MKPILIIIPCLNEEPYIEALVIHLINITKNLSTHIVIADGGSTDNTIHIIKKLTQIFQNVTHLHNPKRLQSAAINLAVQTYGHDAEYLIRIDAHADYPENYVETLVSEAQSQQADSVVTTMRTEGKTTFQRAIAAAQNSKLGNGGSAHRNVNDQGKWVDHGHHALMRIDTFNTIGGYDETFSHNEDAELDTRLCKSGYRIWLTAKTELTYYPRSNVQSLFKQYMNYGKGRARTITKHRAKPKLRQMLPIAVAPALALAILAPFSFLFAIPILLWANICIIYGFHLAKKAKNPQLRASGCAAMVMHLGWSIGFWRGILAHLVSKR
jgi:succinoglycan biosynthesis protein ExoA